MNRRRQEHQSLLPDVATVGVVDVVNLVKDDCVYAVKRHESRGADTLGRRASLEEEVTKDLRGHHDDVSIRAELDVARHNPDTSRRKQDFQIVELLIAQRLDRSRVEDPSAACQRLGDLILADECLPATGLGGDENILAGLDGGNGEALETVRRISCHQGWLRRHRRNLFGLRYNADEIHFRSVGDWLQVGMGSFKFKT